MAFRSDDKQAAKKAQRMLVLQKKMKQKLKQNNLKKVWRSMRNITGNKTGTKQFRGMWNVQTILTVSIIDLMSLW